MLTPSALVAALIRRGESSAERGSLTGTAAPWQMLTWHWPAADGRMPVQCAQKKNPAALAHRGVFSQANLLQL